MGNPRPGWFIYVLLPIGALLLVGVELAAPSAGWRAFTEGLVALVILGAMALWVRVNRGALLLLGNPPQAKQSLRAWVAYSPPGASPQGLGRPGHKSAQQVAA